MNCLRFQFVILCLGTVALCQAQNPLPTLLQKGDERLRVIMENEAIHELQILYTQIDSNKNGKPRFTIHHYGLSDQHYFYPASTVKLPVVLLALEKIKSLQQLGFPISIETPFEVADAVTKKRVAAYDSTHPKNQLTLAHQIKKLFLVSDNQAYNFLFAFVGQEEMNQSLSKKGFKDIVLQHPFSGTHTFPSQATFYFLEEKDTLYSQAIELPKRKASNQRLKGVHKGKGVIDKGKLVTAPMDFSFKNRAALKDLDRLVKTLIYPDLFSIRKRFDLAPAHLDFVRYWMSRNTTEVTVPNYSNDPHYWDSYVKFFVYGDQKGTMDPAVRIYNKVGLAYGTLTDVAYIKNEKEGVEFFLAATLLVNHNQIFNDDTYEYDSLGIPFLAALGKTIYEFELNRKD